MLKKSKNQDFLKKMIKIIIRFLSNFNKILYVFSFCNSFYPYFAFFGEKKNLKNNFNNVTINFDKIPYINYIVFITLLN